MEIILKWISERYSWRICTGCISLRLMAVEGL
jgi:hypothetical protein